MTEEQQTQQAVIGTPTPSSMRRKKRLFSFKFLLLVLLSAALIPLGVAIARGLLSGLLERNAPQIKVLEFPRGIGLAPVQVRIQLSDQETGLAEVVVRVLQRNSVKEVLKQALQGAKTKEITLDFQGRESGLEQGAATIEIRIFDKSFWTNSADAALPLAVDYGKPKVEVLTTQHNALRGGSQLVFYQAYDENLALSGVRIGNQIFPGFPARGIDPDLIDKNLFVSIYALDYSRQDQPKNIRIFAEDVVGNVVSTNFYNKIAERSRKTINENLTEAFIREKIADLAAKQKNPSATEASAGSQFSDVNQLQRAADEKNLKSFLGNSRYERYWNGTFIQPASNIQGVFADRVVYKYNDDQIGETDRLGYEFRTNLNAEVLATADGIVVFVGSIGTYGNVLAIDHGLGLISVYAHLSSAAVSRGESVSKGSVIANAGTTGFSRNPNCYFELRLHGVAVDPREWWDSSWIYNHVTLKIEEVKKSLGIQILRKLE